MRIETLEKALMKQERVTEGRPCNEHGAVLYAAFWSTERYVVDFADDFKSGGWLQFDTDQDAPYFGVWVNPRTLRTLTYAEGDWSLVVCPDRDSYNAEIGCAIDFYREGQIATVIDESGATTYRQDRQKFFAQ